MTSNDNSLDMPRIELLLREHFARTDKQLAEFREQMTGEFSAFKDEYRKEFAAFKEDTRKEFAAFKEDTRREFDKVHAEISIMQSDIRVQNTRIDDLIHWNYWLIAFVVAFFTLPSIAEGLKSLLKALASVIMAKFSSKKNNED